jgi:hypothetical protein
MITNMYQCYTQRVEMNVCINGQYQNFISYFMPPIENAQKSHFELKIGHSLNCLTTHRNNLKDDQFFSAKLLAPRLWAGETFDRCNKVESALHFVKEGYATRLYSISCQNTCTKCLLNQLNDACKTGAQKRKSRKHCCKIERVVLRKVGIEPMSTR